MAIGTFSLVALDCSDAARLAGFYAAITGWEITVPTWADAQADADVAAGRWLQLQGVGSATLAFQQIDDYVAPTWPGGDRPAQLHLDFDVADLDVGERAVLELGATKAAVQPDPDAFRVYLDPAGHPFCLIDASD
jgi:catechol 2,3-dioxygenase-like lactoylglutathione lyase family enzyme